MTGKTMYVYLAGSVTHSSRLESRDRSVRHGPGSQTSIAHALAFSLGKHTRATRFHVQLAQIYSILHIDMHPVIGQKIAGWDTKRQTVFS